MYDVGRGRAGGKPAGHPVLARCVGSTSPGSTELSTALWAEGTERGRILCSRIVTQDHKVLPTYHEVVDRPTPTWERDHIWLSQEYIELHRWLDRISSNDVVTSV